MATPKIEKHIAMKLDEELSSVSIDGSSRNLYFGRLDSTASLPLVSVHVRAFGGQTDLHNDGRYRRAGVQVLVLFKQERDHDVAEELAIEIHDTLDLLGAFTVDGQSYQDVRATVPRPSHIDAGDLGEGFAADYEVWWEG